MKNILYISNIEVPYRVQFLNEFSRHCNLTVVYSRKKSSSRNADWTSSRESCHKVIYLKGIKIGSEDGFSLGLIKHIFNRKYDSIIFGCYNSPVQMLGILLMRLLRRPYILNIDGEVFIQEKSLKTRLKKFFLGGAEKYVTAGEKVAESLKEIVRDKLVIPYYFSSLCDDELKKNASTSVCRSGKVLIVGQYLDVKGLDVILEAAKLDDTVSYKLVGMGNRTKQFVDKYNADKIKNVEIIPFLQKQDLEREYQSCSLFVLPSRQECWGLVINEAASFGAPIVSTWGSGAAVEFLADEYPQYLAKPGDSVDLYKKIKAALKDKNAEVYCDYLKQKASLYSIEHGVEAHCRACDICD